MKQSVTEENNTLIEQPIFSYKYTVNSGYFNIPIQLDDITKGIYTVSTTINGYISTNQIVIQ